MRLDPPYADLHAFSFGQAAYLTERYEEAMTALKRTITRDPQYLGAHAYLAAIYSELGWEAKARAEAAEVLRINPTFSLEALRQTAPYKDPATIERSLAALRKAGLK